MRRTLSVLAVLTVGLLAGCAADVEPSVATEIVTVTAMPSTPTPTSASDPGPALAASFAELTARLGQPVGVSIMPVGGGEVVNLGEQTPQVAWSTIKVPLALAAQRKNGPSEAARAAIVDSDNASAEALWASLGTPDEASAAVTAVLREGGDGRSTVPSQRLRPEFTIFGQTSWALPDAAAFTAHLPCLPGAQDIVALMGQVSGNQQWGIELIPGRTTAVKGGWGPSVGGGYVVRQIALLTRRDGKQVAFALSTYAPGGTLGSGIAALNQVSQWVGRNLAALPGGRCAR